MKAWRKWMQECQRRGLDAPSGRNGSGQLRLRSVGRWDGVDWSSAFERVEVEGALVERGFDATAAVVVTGALGRVQAIASSMGSLAHMPRAIDFVLDRSAEWASTELAMAISNPGELVQPWPMTVAAASRRIDTLRPQLEPTNVMLGAPAAPELEATSWGLSPEDVPAHEREEWLRIWDGPNSRVRYLPNSGS